VIARLAYSGSDNIKVNGEKAWEEFVPRYLGA
jgi:hypothetical protein